MAIYVRKRKKGLTYQVKVKGVDGRWITETFLVRRDAEYSERVTFNKKYSGTLVSKHSEKITLNNFVSEWHEETKGGRISAGWRNDQLKYFQKYVAPVIGTLPMTNVKPLHISRVLKGMEASGLSSQMRLHVYGLLHKMFEDAIELFEILLRNPVKRSLRPKVRVVNTPKALSVEESETLLRGSEDKWFGPAVWMQLLLGLRIGEVQALRWRDIDLSKRELRVTATYVRKEKRFKDSPKGGKQLVLPMPFELITYLSSLSMESGDDLVVRSPRGGHLAYETYWKCLRHLCHANGIPPIGSHTLRHSTWSIYEKFGATESDMRCLFGHSNSKVTDRYIHGRIKHLRVVANNIRVLERQVSPNVSPGLCG